MGFGLVETEVVNGGPGGQVSELCWYGEGIVGGDNEKYVVSIFEEEIARGERMEIRSIEDEGCRAKGRALNNTGRDTGWRGCVAKKRSTMLAPGKETSHPVINVVRQGKKGGL